MSDELVRSGLQRIASEARVVDLSARVSERSRSLRRRRAVAAGVIAALLAVVAVSTLAVAGDQDAAPPAGRLTAPTVVLGDARTGGLPRVALAVVDTSSGTTWLVSRAGRAVRLPIRAASLPGTPPSLSATGGSVVLGGLGEATVVRGADSAVTRLALRAEQHYAMSVSPAGDTVAYAADNGVDGVDLTLQPLDMSPPITLGVTASAAAGVLVPVVWSDDGRTVLVLDGQGATMVDLEPSPRARRSVHMRDDLVLSSGWAASPDLSRFMAGRTMTDDGRRTWRVLDSSDGRAVTAVARPADDRLIGWSSRDRLVWWHETDGGYAVVTTDVDGRRARTEMRLVTRERDLIASWADGGS